MLKLFLISLFTVVSNGQQLCKNYCQISYTQEFEFGACTAVSKSEPLNEDDPHSYFSKPDSN